MPRHNDLSGIKAGQGRKNADGGGFSCTIRTQQGKNLPVFDVEIKLIKRLGAGREYLGEAAYLYHNSRVC